MLVPRGVWSLQGGGFGRLAGGVLESGGAWSLEGGGLVPGEAPGPGSQEGEWLAWLQEGEGTGMLEGG